MRRRAFLGGVGVFTALGGTATGTGAFTATTADRRLSVTVVPDSEALLTLIENGDGGRSSVDSNGEVKFHFPGTDENSYTTGNPQGLGTDSVYEFDGDADTDSGGLFAIRNKGTQPVNVYLENGSDGSGKPTIEMYDVTDPAATSLDGSNVVTLSVGDSVDIGLQIDTHGVPLGDYDMTVSINAVAT
ncbi:hypothetical protein BRD22_06915 [Halobacteriales archaeon SW_8_68_21]|nr:MAG: hypothetical protein BRD22_06915 [Halobacteriales archaeon SW_8_68_21]